MALLPTPVEETGAKKILRTQFTIASASAGSNGTVYTVPDGKNFIGYFWMQYPTGSNERLRINSVDVYVGRNQTYGTWYAFPLYLSAGDVVSNYSSEYFIITGYEE